MNRLLYPLAFIKPSPPAVCRGPAEVGTVLPPGAHHLLPMWEEFTAALPKLGPLMAVTRNAHVIMGGMTCGAALAGQERTSNADVLLRYDFRHWQRGWFAAEELHGEDIEGFEIADAANLGFLKFIFVSDPMPATAQMVRRAFENGPLAPDSLDELLHANHLDGACCQECERLQTEESRSTAQTLERLIAGMAEAGGEMHVILPHAGCVAVRRFSPRRTASSP